MENEKKPQEKSKSVKSNRKLPIRLSIDLSKTKTQELTSKQNKYTIFQVGSDEFALELRFDDNALYLWSSLLLQELPEEAKKEIIENL